MPNVRFHWQNLNERRRDFNGQSARGFPWEGRCWLHLWKDCLRLEWCFWNKSCAISLELDDDESEATFHVAIPLLLSFWIGCSRMPNWLRRLVISKDAQGWNTYRRKTSLAFHNWSLWWCFWKDDDSWCSTDSRWRCGSLNVPDLLMGRMNYSQRLLDKRTVDIPMPEGRYPAEVEISEDSWKRSRFPITRRIVRAHVDMKIPIPHEGKGSCAHNCGDDALHGITCRARDVAEAIGETVESVMRDRDRYGDIKREWPEPVEKKG